MVDATGCGLLLDVTNAYTNATNYGFDVNAFIDALPLDHVVQVHLAGGYWADGILVDSHARPVPPQVWNLFRTVCRRVPVRATLLEHDQDFPDFNSLLDQVATARRIMTEPAG